MFINWWNKVQPLIEATKWQKCTCSHTSVVCFIHDFDQQRGFWNKMAGKTV